MLWWGWPDDDDITYVYSVDLGSGDEKLVIRNGLNNQLTEANKSLKRKRRIPMNASKLKVNQKRKKFVYSDILD